MREQETARSEKKRKQHIKNNVKQIEQSLRSTECPIPAGIYSAKVIPGLPEIEYPSPVSVRNTFLDTDIGRSGMLNGAELLLLKMRLIASVLAHSSDARSP